MSSKLEVQTNMENAIDEVVPVGAFDPASGQPLPIGIVADPEIARLVREIEEQTRPKAPPRTEEHPLTRRAPYAYD